MTSIDVVGGVYGERCAFPDWNEIFGSVGRAAVGLSPHVDRVRLHTVLPNEQVNRVIPNFQSFGVDVSVQPGKQLIGFDYLHCLANPIISPHPDFIDPQPTFEVQSDVVVAFGMMECQPSITAEFCVYDPQSSLAPKGFRETGGSASRLAFVANQQEIERLTGSSGTDAAMQLVESERAEVVIAKRGLAGAFIYGSGGFVGSVPAFKTSNVFTVGSGDVFVAAFALAWATNNLTPMDAALFASKAAAKYIETSSLPMLSLEDAAAGRFEPVNVEKGTIYLAGPFRELGQRKIVNDARDFFRSLGLEVFSPVHDVGHGPAEKIVSQDLKALDECDVVFAILNGSSPGTLFEIGYAIHAKRPVFCVAQNMRENDIKLPVGSGCFVHTDFVSALHSLVWRT
ncbi:MAG: PfkB family carbohydrate kinase [Ahrensia sp.]|nr:PfkB family carbohydrate kinase [Ahrensia sp.]